MIITKGILNSPIKATLKRLISAEVNKGNKELLGKGPSTRYRLSHQAQMTMELNLDR